MENEYAYKLSYVIPAYNAEYTLESCVKSIVSISSNTEAIIVNDGSVDQTLEVAKRIQRNYPDQVTIINQKNLGVSAARNIGIMRARGEYVAFSDADDVVETEKVRCAVTKIQPDAQVIMFNYHVIENGKKNYTPLAKEILQATDKKDAILKRLLYFRLSKKEPNSNIGGKVFQYFFRTSFLMSFEIKFSKELSFAEDLVFCCKALQCSSAVQIIDLPIYRYFIFGGSAAHRYRENYWNELKAVYEELKASCPMYINNGFYYYYARTALYHIIQYFKNGTISYSTAKEKSDEILEDKKVYDDLQSIKGHFRVCEWYRNRALINGRCVLLIMKNVKARTRICRVSKLVAQKSKNILNKLKYRIIKLYLGGGLEFQRFLLRESGVTFGENVCIYNSEIDKAFGFLITMGNNVTITNAKVFAHDASMHMYLGKSRVGKIKIGNNVFIGANSVILPGVSIGDDVVIGAGTVVSKDIENNSVVVGNPMKVIGKTDEFIRKHANNMRKFPVWNTYWKDKSKEEREDMASKLEKYGYDA